jgi:biotin carboxyl carrier protein
MRTAIDRYAIGPSAQTSSRAAPPSPITLSDCLAGADTDQRAKSVVIHVVAEAAAANAQPDPQMSGEAAVEPITEPAPPTRTPKKQPTAVLTSGGGVVPAPMLAELIRDGAQLRPLIHPGNRVTPEPGYRPSAALDTFVRCRDMTCRFPNCDQPAEFCDVDHTIPYPLGLTHPSNLKCLCRKHALHRHLRNRPQSCSRES